MDKRIDTLKPGGRVVLSTANGLTVAVERSGDGKTLRIVRESASGFSVIRTERF
jgi:hypothetical protein